MSVTRNEILGGTSGYIQKENLAGNLDNSQLFDNGVSVGLGTVLPSADTKFHIKGIDATASNYALKVDNSASSTLLYVRNDGNIYYNTDLSILRSVGGTNRVLIGGGSAGTFAVGIGSVTASGDRSIAMGDNATSSGEQSISMGYFASATGQFAIALGRVSSASTDGVSIGANTTAQLSGVAIGCGGVYANGNSVAIGRGAGSSSISRGTEYISIGYFNNGSTFGIGTGSTSIGGYSYASGNFGGTFGAYLASTAGGAFVFGVGITGTSTPLINNISNSLMFGCNSDVPTLFVSGGNGTSLSTGSVGVATTSPTAKLHVEGDFKTAQPSASGAGAWKLGKVLNAASVLDGSNYVEVEIDGVIYKLALIL
jgi:hypothetical protein